MRLLRAGLPAARPPDHDTLADGTGVACRAGSRLEAHFPTRLLEGRDQLVELLLHTRLEARKAKQFALADKIRADLHAFGYEVEDLPGGKWAVKKR